jgi:hypothetical protein
MAALKYFDSLSRICEAIGQDGDGSVMEDTSELFKRSACRVLLGKDNSKSSEGLRAQLADQRPTGRLNIDLAESTNLAAVAELNGRSGVEIARRGLSHLKSHKHIDEEDYQTTESALALSMLTENQKAVNRWFKAGLALPEYSDKPYTYELLFLASLKAPDNADIEIAANAVARITFDNIGGAPYYSAAPHNCALAALARQRRKNLKQLMRDRVRILDDIVFGSGSTPRLDLKEPAFSLRRQENEQAVLEIEMKVMGGGKLDIGAYPLAPVTYDLPKTIQGIIAKVNRMRGQKKSENVAILEDALFKKTGHCYVVVNLAAGVVISDKHDDLLRKRCRLGWKIAQHRLKKLVCRFGAVTKALKEDKHG